MASRNSGSDGGGCLAYIVVFFVTLLLPAGAIGDDFGWGDLILWWIILVAIIGFLYMQVPFLIRQVQRVIIRRRTHMVHSTKTIKILLNRQQQ